MQWRSKFSLNLCATTFLLKQWTLDELMIGLSSSHHGRHQNIPASKMNFFSSKEFFLLSFLFRNCVSLNPLLWLCFKNCFCQRHNAPNYHTCPCQQISESFFWSERKKRLCDKIDDIQQDINIINIKTIKSSINTCIKPKVLIQNLWKKHQLIYLQNLVFIQRFLGLWMSDMLLQPLGGWGGLDCTDCRSLMAN